MRRTPATRQTLLYSATLKPNVAAQREASASKKRLFEWHATPHPTTPGAHDFVTVGMLGFIGAFTGQSSAQMGVSEIGVSFPDTTYFGSESFAGVPFVFALRDILEFDNAYTDSVTRLQTANRTCDLILAVGDGKAQTARSFAVSASEIFVFDDTNLQPWNATNTWHPRFPEIVWHAMDWLCPGYSIPMAAQLTALYGKLSPANIISDILGRVQTGDVHAAVYDLTSQVMYVSFMAPNHAPGPAMPEMAYARPFTALTLDPLFALPPPAL